MINHRSSVVGKTWCGRTDGQVRNLWIKTNCGDCYKAAQRPIPPGKVVSFALGGGVAVAQVTKPAASVVSPKYGRVTHKWNGSLQGICGAEDFLGHMRSWKNVSCRECLDKGVFEGKAEALAARIELYGGGKPTASSTSYPHKCPRCSKPAYIGFTVIDCSGGCK